jgi:hypothetical protein
MGQLPAESRLVAGRWLGLDGVAKVGHASKCELAGRGADRARLVRFRTRARWTRP